MIRGGAGRHTTGTAKHSVRPVHCRTKRAVQDHPGLAQATYAALWPLRRMARSVRGMHSWAPRPHAPDADRCTDWLEEACCTAALRERGCRGRVTPGRRAVMPPVTATASDKRLGLARSLIETACERRHVTRDGLVTAARQQRDARDALRAEEGGSACPPGRVNKERHTEKTKYTRTVNDIFSV